MSSDCMSFDRDLDLMTLGATETSGDLDWMSFDRDLDLENAGDLDCITSDSEIDHDLETADDLDLGLETVVDLDCISFEDSDRFLDLDTLGA